MLGGDVGSIELRALFKLGIRDLEVLVRRLQEVPPESRVGLIRRVVALINEGKLGDAKLLIHTGNAQFSDSGVGNVAEGVADSEAGSARLGVVCCLGGVSSLLVMRTRAHTLGSCPRPPGIGGLTPWPGHR